MANISAVRQALADVIQNYTVPALAAFGTNQDQINPPCALVLPAKNLGTYGVTLVGNPATQSTLLAVTEFNLDVYVLVARASTINRVEKTLDQWLGFELDSNVVSVPMAIALNENLGGACQYCEPINVDSYGPIEWNTVTYFGARIHTKVSMI